MSSEAAVGPHSRPQSMNAANLRGQGVNGAVGPSGGGKRVLPHIDDLFAAKPDVNIHAPIRRLLLEADSYAKAADTNLDFRRPDLALQAYIRASIVAVNIIPRHKEFPELKADRGELHRLYTTLQKKISSHHAKFEEVKAQIKQDNARTGVRPVLGETSDPHDGMPDNVLSNPTQSSIPAREPEGLRKKPVVQPKPDSLHGKAITQARHSPSQIAQETSTEELAARFARLRSADSSSTTPPVQDPRIRTRPIPMPHATDFMVRPNGASSQSPLTETLKDRLNRPSGPRDMPIVPIGPPRPAKIRLEMEIPSMPRPPDAIYSPARNSDDSQRPSIARQSSHTMQSGPRRSSSAFSTNGPRTSISERREYFPPQDVQSRAVTPKESAFILPKTTTATAEELFGYLKRGSHDLRILIVDIRSREQFDSGHIMSQSIICIEPIALREGMSADDIGQSLILSPESEQKLFDRRHEFDLVVYYDQSSVSNRYSGPTSNVEEIALRDFSKAVYDYGYDKQLKRRPMLLLGGLDAWIDLIGPGALKTSETVGVVPRAQNGYSSKTKSITPHPVERQPVQRRRTYESRPLTQDEESKWAELLKTESQQINEKSEHEGIEGSFVKTTEDFLRRFPDPSTLSQQSMVSPSRVSARDSTNTTTSNQGSQRQREYNNDLDSLMLRAPTQPPPLIPRQSINGQSSDVGTWSLPKIEPTTITHPIVPRGHTGLWNPNNLCYMNSVIQALSATDWLPRYLLEGAFDEAGPPPRKDTEVSIPPQLMARNLANLFRHLWSGQYTFVTPKSIRNYIYRVARGMQQGLGQTLGDTNQHDAQELLMFILELLIDETNPNRNVEPSRFAGNPQDDLGRQKLSHSQGMTEWMADFNAHEGSSPIARKFSLHTVASTECGFQGCMSRSRVWASNSMLVLELDTPPRGSGMGMRQNLTDMLTTRFFTPASIPNYQCDLLAHHADSTQTTRMAHLPDNLIIQIARYGEDGVTKKSTTVLFPLVGLDLSRYALTDEQIAPTSPKRPFIYDCYAVIQHSGNTLRAGHYWTLVKDQSVNRWFRFDDSRVYAALEKDTQTRESYILFYKRQGSSREGRI